MNENITGFEDEKSSLNSWMIFSNLLAFLILFGVIVFAFIMYSLKTPGDNIIIDDGTNNDSTYISIIEKANLDIEKLEGEIENLNDSNQIITDILTIRNDIIKDISAKMLLDGLDVVVDNNTGIISFKDVLFFSSNGTEITDTDKSFLVKFIPAYLSVLLSDKYIDYIENIGILGHADDGGNYVYNLGLSYNRAYSVAEYVIGMDLEQITGIADTEKYLKIIGFSSSSPIIVNGEIDRDRSRRVEFTFQLKDNEFLKQIWDELSGEPK
jgi:chemotaxis protein MotB